MSWHDSRYALLQRRTEAFCAAFTDLANNPPDKILSEHFTPNRPQITEHGPSWASTRLPFLGKTFSGRDSCLEYFDQLSRVLEFIPTEDSFPPKEKFVVDEKTCGDETGGEPKGQVSVAAKGTFKCIQTGQSWDEQFIYRLSNFDEQGKIGHWEIWADPLSAWMAVGGELAMQS